jgi:hypothetical protein
MRRALGKFDSHATAAELTPIIERPGDPNERLWINELDAAEIHSDDSGSDRNVRNDCFSARCGEVGKQSNDVDRRAVLMRFEPNLAYFHTTLP